MKQISIQSLYLTLALAASAPALATIDFSDGPTAYTNSAVVITPTTALTSTSA